MKQPRPLCCQRLLDCAGVPDGSGHRGNGIGWTLFLVVTYLSGGVPGGMGLGLSVTARAGAADIASLMPPNSTVAVFLFILPLPSVLRVEAERVPHRSCMEHRHSSRLARRATYARWPCLCPLFAVG